MASPDATSDVCRFLSKVRGVAAVEITSGTDGGIEAIDIVVEERGAGSRVVRDVESALMSRFGLSLDHRDIRVRETGTPSNGRVKDHELEDSGNGRVRRGERDQIVREPSGGGRLNLLRVECEPDGELYCSVSVELEADGRRFSGHSKDADTAQARLLSSGRATVEAVRCSQREEIALALEAVEEFSICGEDAVLALVQTRRGPVRRALQGAALLDGSREEAVARAVLDSLNRLKTSAEV